ncbi:unnamed protein product [Phytomonas sp. EM1]|nr:unnamed protein product [Phytomonas sp. EM1]|eukprot:CCW60130.1 unnamed protein product [Phytomonas sp. isolate EM1]
MLPMHCYGAAAKARSRRRFGVWRVPTHPSFRKLRLGITPAAGLDPRRFYYSSPPGYPPPPPPPPSSGGNPENASGFYPPLPGPYTYPPGFYGFPPASPVSYNAFPGDLGTKERPIVVTSTTSKLRWVWRLGWMFLLGSVLAFSLPDDVFGQFHESMDSSKVSGVPQGLQTMLGSAEVKPVNLETLETTFEDIRGCDEAKKELAEIVDFLKDPEKFHELGSRLPKGVLLVGPPGCGKTLLAKAIAKEAGVSFFYATGSEFDEMFVGVGSRRIRDLFAAAKARAPALIFIDEIDALGGKRSRADHAYSRMTLNQLLAEMDGFQTNESVIILAATNTPETLDKALTRPGRLDTTVVVDPPDMKGRAEVLQLYLDKIKVDGSVNAMEIARGTTGFTGAELSNLVNLAAIRAAVLNKPAVSKHEVEFARDRVMMGAASQKVIPERERLITAYHEGAHALVAMLLKDQGAEPVHKATIVPRGNGIMGLVQQMPERDKYSKSRRECLAALQVCVAGRIGEEVLLGKEDITTGAGSDFHQATTLARNMVRRFGFSEDLGFIDYESSDTPEGAYMSDETKRRIEKEIQKLVRESYVEAKKLLEGHQAELKVIVDHLLKYETLSGPELEKILKGEPIPARTIEATPAPSPPRSSSRATSNQKKQKTVPIS